MTELAERTTITGSVLDLLREQKQAMTCVEIADVLGVPKKAIYNAMYRAELEGLVVGERAPVPAPQAFRRYRPVTPPDAQRRRELQAACMRQVAEVPMTALEVANNLERPFEQVVAALWDLCTAGEVVRRVCESRGADEGDDSPVPVARRVVLYVAKGVPA